MTEATQGSPAAATSNGAAHHPSIASTQSTSSAYTTYCSGGASKLQQYLSELDEAQSLKELGFGTGYCILEKAVKDGDKQTVELLCDRFSASVLQRTLHLNSAEKSLLEQVIECNAEQNPTIALEILRKLCGTCANECAKSGQKFGVVAKDLIGSLLDVTSMSQDSTIASYSADSSWGYQAISDNTELQRTQKARKEQSEQYRKDAQSAYEEALDTSRTGTGHTHSAASHAQPSSLDTKHSDHTHDSGSGHVIKAEASGDEETTPKARDVSDSREHKTQQGRGAAADTDKTTRSSTDANARQATQGPSGAFVAVSGRHNNQDTTAKNSEKVNDGQSSDTMEREKKLSTEDAHHTSDDNSQGVSELMEEEEEHQTASSTNHYTAAETRDGLSHDEVEQLRTSVEIDIDGDAVPGGASTERKAVSARSGAAARPQQATPRKAKAPRRNSNGGRFARTTHHDLQTRSAEGHDKHDKLGDLLQFAEQTKSNVETVVVELKSQTIPRGASTVLEKISTILKKIGEEVRYARDKVGGTIADAATQNALLAKIVGLLKRLADAIRDLLTKLVSTAQQQAQKLTTILNQVTDKVREFGAEISPIKRARIPSGHDDMAPTAKRGRAATTVPTALLNEILAAAEQGKLADALKRHIGVLSDPEMLHEVLSCRNAASLDALDLCVAKPHNIEDITSAIRALINQDNSALGTVLAYHLTRGRGQHGQSIIRRIIGAAVGRADPSVVNSTKALVTRLIGELCPNSSDIGQRLLAGHVALSALQAGSEDILSHAMTVAAIPGSNLVHNPTQDAIVASVITWIENRECKIDSVEDRGAVKAVMSLLKSSGKVSPSAVQEMVARCSVPSTAALVYEAACECDVIDPSAKCSTGTQAYVTRYELARAMGALHSTASSISGPESADLRTNIAQLLGHIDTILTDVSTLTGEQWVRVAVQLVPRTQALTTKVQHICDGITADTAAPKIAEIVAPTSQDARQISLMIRDVVKNHPAKRIKHTPRIFDTEGAASSKDQNLLAASERLHSALESARSAYKGPFREISIENFANSLSDAERDVVSAIMGPADDPTDTLRLELKNATRKIVDAISDNPHLVFCDQKVTEEMMHAATLLELAAKHEALGKRRSFAKDRTSNELVNSFREKAANAYYHIAQAYRLVEEHSTTALRERGGESVALVREKLLNAGNYVKRAVKSVHNSIRVTNVLEAEAWLQYGKNELSHLGTRLRNSETLLHFQRAARSAAEHVAHALVFLRLAVQILKDIVVHTVKVASGSARVTDILNNPESNLLDIMPAMRTRIRDADTALSRGNQGADYDKLREALHSADSILSEIDSALSSGNRGFLDGNAPHLVLHACAREISQRDFSATPQLSSKMSAVLTDLESVVGRLVDIKVLNTLEQSPAVEVPKEFVRSSLKTLAYTLQVRSAAAGVRALVPSNRLAEIARLLPVSDGKVVITSGADFAVVLRALIEEHNITHVRNAANRDDPIVVLSEMSRAVERSTRGAQAAGTETDSVHTAAVPVQFVYNALVACSNAMQLSTAIDGIQAQISGDMLNEIIVAGLPNDARHSRMVSDASVISAMIDNLIRLHRGLMHQDAVYTAHNASGRGCLDLVREVINQKSKFDLGRAVPASIYSTEPRAAFIGGVVEQALIMHDGGFLGTQAGSRDSESGGRTVTVSTDVARSVVVAAMHAIQEAVIRDRRGRTIPPSLPSDAIERIVSDRAASPSSDTVNLSAQVVSDAFKHFEDEMLAIGALAPNSKIGDELVNRVVSVVLHIAARYTGVNASPCNRGALSRHVEKMVTSLYIETQKGCCRDAIRSALQEVQGVDQNVVKEAAKYATTLVTSGSSAGAVHVSSCVSLAREIASTLSVGNITTQSAVEESLFRFFANSQKQGVVAVSERFFANLFTAIRDSVKSAHAAVSAEAVKAPLALAFAALTDEMIQNLAQGVTKVHDVALDFWENGTVIEESSRVSAKEAEQRATTAASSVDNVPLDLARTVLITTISAVRESIARAEHLGTTHAITEQQIATLVDSKLGSQQEASQDGTTTVRVTSDLVSGILTELNGAIQQTQSTTGMSNRVQISEDLHPAIARIAVSAIKAGKTAGNSISEKLLDSMQHDVHAACGTAITAPTTDSQLSMGKAAGSTPAPVLDLATVFAGLNDAKGVMEEVIAGSNLNEGQKERIKFAIGEAESLMEHISTSSMSTVAERLQDSIRLVVSTIAGIHRDGNLAPGDQCAMSTVYGILVTQLGLVEAASISENARIVQGHDYKRLAPSVVEVGHSVVTPEQQEAHSFSDIESGGAAQSDRTVIGLCRATRLLRSISQFLAHNGTYNTLQGGKLMRHLGSAGHSLERAQQAALHLLLARIAGGGNGESVVPHEQALQQAIIQCQEFLLNAKLVAAPLPGDAVSMLSGLSDAVTLLQETSQQEEHTSWPQRISKEDQALTQIFRMVSLARSAADDAQKEKVAAPYVCHDEIAARDRALMSLGAVENLVGFLYDARTQRDAKVVEQILSHLEQCRNNLQAQLIHRRNAASQAKGVQRDTVQHYSTFVQVAMHAVHIAHDLIREHVHDGANILDNILSGWEVTANSLSSAQSNPQEVRLRAAALIDVYEAVRDASTLVSEVCVKTEHDVFVPRKSASQVLCESVYASGPRITNDAPQHQEVERELTVLVGDALSAKTLLNQVCTKLAGHEDSGIAQLMGNIEYATDTMLNRNRGIVASKEVTQLSDRIAVLTKSGLRKLAAAAGVGSSSVASTTTDLVQVSGSATTQTPASPASARRALTAAQWFGTIVDVSSCTPGAVGVQTTAPVQLQEIQDISQSLAEAVQLLYGYGLGTQLDAVQKDIVNSLKSAVGLLPLFTGTGGHSTPESLHPNTVNVVYRLGGSDIPQGNIGALAAKFEVITHKLSLLTSLGDLRNVAVKLKATHEQGSDAKARQAATQFDGIVKKVTELVKSVVQQIDNAAPVRGLEAPNAEGNRIVLQELRNVAVGALTRGYEKRGLRGMRESIESVRKSIGQKFVVVDSTLLRNMFSLGDVDSAEALCSTAALPPEHSCVEKVIATIADALRTNRVDSVRALSCLDGVLKNSIALGTLYTSETGAYALREADITDMLIAFYERNDENGISFLHGKCSSYTIDSSRIESAVLARLSNNTSLNAADTLLLDLYNRDIFTDPDVSIRQCQDAEASFLEIHLSRAYGFRGIHREGSIMEDDIGTAGQKQPNHGKKTPNFAGKLLQTIPKMEKKGQQPWYARLWQWIKGVIDWCRVVAGVAVMLIQDAVRVRRMKAQHSSRQQQETQQVADIHSARSTDTGSGKGAPDDKHDRGADDKKKAPPSFSDVAVLFRSMPKLGEGQRPWYAKLWQWVKDVALWCVYTGAFVLAVCLDKLGIRKLNRSAEPTESGKRAPQEAQQEQSNNSSIAKEENHRGVSEAAEAKPEVAEEHSPPTSDSQQAEARSPGEDELHKSQQNKHQQGAAETPQGREGDTPSSTITDPEIVKEVSRSQDRRNSV